MIPSNEPAVLLEIVAETANLQSLDKSVKCSFRLGLDQNTTIVMCRDRKSVV